MQTLKHEFVQYIPEQVEDGIIYISMKYRVAVHKCVCGCGNNVVTPFSPTDWELRFYGDSISLSPSIGNWNFDCQSHYWIVKNQIRHSTKWDEDQIRKGREYDRVRKDKYFRTTEEKPTTDSAKTAIVKKKGSTHWLKSLLSNLGIN
jgi:hypothetical protein